MSRLAAGCRPRLVGFGLTLLTVAVASVVLTLLVVGPLFGGGAELAEDLGVDGWFTVLWTWFRWPTVFGVLVVWAASLYHIAPNHRSPWKWELPGAVLASVWWAVASLGFGQYLQTAASGANAVFGLLGGALSLLFWLYLMSMGLLLGAEVNSVIAGRNGFSSSSRNLADHSVRSLEGGGDNLSGMTEYRAPLDDIPVRPSPCCERRCSLRDGCLCPCRTGPR